MAIQFAVHHLRRAWRWSLASTLFATSVPILEYLGSGNAWPFWLTGACALVAWFNLIVQTRLLRSVSRLPAG
jgi:hypothetical protein